eukprot:2217547-Rhodomonas_salina.2
MTEITVEFSTNFALMGGSRLVIAGLEGYQTESVPCPATGARGFVVVFLGGRFGMGMQKVGFGVRVWAEISEFQSVISKVCRT